MIIAVCDPKGIAIEAIKTILYHDKGLSDRISRIYEFWNMEQLLDASRDSSFDCIVFPNYCNSHNSVVCSLSCGYNRFPLVEHDPRYTLIVRDILYWETARSLWTQYLKAIVYGLSRLIVSCGDFLDAILTEVMVINDMILFGT